MSRQIFKILSNAFLGSVFLFFLFGVITPAKASAKNIYFFYGDGCPHCAKEEKFLDYLEKTDTSVKVFRYEVWHDKDNQKLLAQAAKSLKLGLGSVPVTIINNEAIIGFDEPETTGVKIDALVNQVGNGPQRDVVGELLNGREQAVKNDLAKTTSSTSSVSTIKSFFGEVNINKLSLPVLTIVLGLLDSLNPCAMWVLLFLLSMLLVGGDRKRMLVLGSGFIAASAITYFLFLSAWLNIYLLLGVLSWLKLIIIVVAIVTGLYNLREYWRNRKGGCEIQDAPKRRLIMDRLRQAAQHNSLWLALFGVVTLASVINLVELLCSAGLPAVYIPVLTEAGLPKWQYYSYLLLYVFFYVLDQIVVFLIATFSLKLTAISSKITKWSNLFGGIIMIVLAIWLLVQWY